MKPGALASAKTFGVLALAQAACLALGLWLETQFTRAVAGQAANSPAQTCAVGVGPETALQAIAFAWIAAPQMLVAYLVLSQVQKTSERKELRASEALLQHHNDLVRTRDAVIFGLAKLAESRDPETGDHLERIVLYSTLLAKSLRHHSRYHEQVTASFIKLIGISAALHDIGKVGVRDSVLLKQGSLTPEERRLMETHTEIGGHCLKDIERRLGGSNFLQMARQIALAHHEHWDGTGYPKGLVDESIPLPARIVAIADVYDALTARRVYKEAYSHERAVKIITDGAGSHFDPNLVDVFLKTHADFRDIAERCRHLPSPTHEVTDRAVAAAVSTDEAVRLPQVATTWQSFDVPSPST